MIARINWDPSPRQLREFGLVILAGFGIIGGVLLYRHHADAARRVWEISGAVGLLALIVPTLAKPFYWLWMGLGMMLGTVTSRIVLCALFYGLFTPVALIFRWRGRDALRREKPASTSYWQDHPEITKESYRHLF